MTTFDGWDACLYGDELMHSRTKGSKNGVRRYQTESGKWTPLGLRERRIREGWGDGDGNVEKAERKARKAERKVEKAEHKAERKAEREKSRAEHRAAREQRNAERREALRVQQSKHDVSKLTDEELQKKIERVKMELEYKELTKSPLLKKGEQLVSDYIERKTKKEQQALQDRRDKVAHEREMEKLKEQTKLAELKSDADKARANADAAAARANEAKAEADAERARTDYKDIEAGTRAMALKNERKQLRFKKKEYVADNTIRGGIRKQANKYLTLRGQARGEAKGIEYKSKAEANSAIRKGDAEARVAVNQASKLNKYNKKNGYSPVAATIGGNNSGGTPNQAPQPQPNQNNGGGKKKHRFRKKST